MAKQKEDSERYCSSCKKYKKWMPEIVDAQILSWNHGKGYTGKPFNYCPWCGSKLKIKGVDDESKVSKKD
jgi:rRNA maturation endonuclease Nob1